MQVADLTGQKFGRLTVLKLFGTKNKKREWICQCDCGVLRTIPANHLRSGHTTSCGCFKREQLLKALIKHGQGGQNKRTPTYISWSNMHSRCLNPSNERYRDYGGRGIVICDEWEDFRNFYWEMGDKPKGRTLDRIDNDGPYAGWNCRWATPSEQRYNQRRMNQHA